MSAKEKKELTEEEKECKSKRKHVQEKLIKFATCIPVFMYLDFRNAHPPHARRLHGWGQGIQKWRSGTEYDIKTDVTYPSAMQHDSAQSQDCAFCILDADELVRP